ncbi:MAG: hypothetical protein KU37_04975 [Sulfuricurvum sp. PC08-66]|nr:MAG: hypothetical protein KU37_04975 [Sulfuricurvum sp. PC08-66]
MQYIEAVVQKLAPLVQESLEKLEGKSHDSQQLLRPVRTLKRGFDAMQMLVDLQHNRFEMVPERVDLLLFTQSLLERFTALASSHKVEYFYFIDPTLASHVFVDSKAWAFMLSTFVENAIVHNKAQGSCHILIKQAQLEEGRATLQLTVTDSGKGISKEDMPLLLHPFFPQAQGLGIDIAVTYRLLKLLQSGLKVASTPNKGSRFGFSLTLPIEGSPKFVPLSQRRVAMMVDEKSLVTYAKMAQHYLQAWKVETQGIEDEHDERIGDVDVVLLFANDTEALQAIQARFAQANVVLVGSKPPAQKVPFLPLPLRIELLYKVLQDATQVMYTPPPAPKAPQAVHVLIAEDNPINLKLVQMVLGRYNFHIQIAKDGQEALEKAKAHRFNLILMDLEMPNMDGFAATEAIRSYEAQQGFEKTPIIALTSHDRKGQREIVLSRGLDDYLAKPLNIAKLEALLERIIGFSRV